MGIEEHDKEGRLITLEFEDFYFITVYKQTAESRLRHSAEFRIDFLSEIIVHAAREYKGKINEVEYNG